MDETFYVIFDLDDTLFPESEFVFSGFSSVAEYLATRSTFSSDELYNYLRRDFEDGIRGDNFDRLLAETGIHIDIDELVTIYRTHSPDIELLNDAETCLNQLSDRPLGLITDGAATKQRAKLNALEITDWFEAIYISEEFGPDCEKPSTKMFNDCLDDAEQPPDQTVYIADNPSKDFVAPNRLGMRSIWVKRPWGEYADQEPTADREQPTAKVEDLRAVPDLVTQWESEA